MFISTILFNEGLVRKLKGQSYEDYLKELLVNGKAKKEIYNVSASISFNDLSTGCMVHLLDIGNDSVMCLYGQYLYDYEPIDDEPELNQPRKFPTKQFSLIRRVKDSEVLDIEPGEEVLETVYLDNPEIEKMYDFGFELQDGEIKRQFHFDKLLTLHSRGTR